MNGQTNRYRNFLESCPGPILLSQCPRVKMDMRGMVKYAKDKGVQPIDLSDEEKKKFLLSIEE